MNKIETRVDKQTPANLDLIVQALRKGLNFAAGTAIHSARTDKYTSINVHDNYIEFRSPGGDWLNADINLLKNTINRCVLAMQIGCDPDAYKEEYAKKLYALLDRSLPHSISDIKTIRVIHQKYLAQQLNKKQATQPVVNQFIS